MSHHQSLILPALDKKVDTEKLVKRAQSLHIKNLLQEQQLRRNRSNSIGPLEDLIQCGICLEKMTDPRMLPCQHTFCLSCLESYVIARHMQIQPQPPSVTEIKAVLGDNVKKLICPTCQRRFPLENGLASIEKLPKNLYIDSLMKFVDGNASTTTTSIKPNDTRCVKCKTVSKEQEHICQHCLQVFCSVCWNEHLAELEINVSTLKKQLEESEIRLKFKMENIDSRCEQLKENVKEAMEQKQQELDKLKMQTLKNVQDINNQGQYTLQDITRRIAETKDAISSKNTGTGSSKVLKYLSLHKETSKLLDEVNKFGEDHIIFDKNTFKLEQHSEGIYNELDDSDVIIASRIIKNPLESQDSLTIHYKTRSYNPKLIWNKCPRPGGMAICPWDNTKLYIASTDNHHVIIFDKDRNRVVGSMTSEKMLHPQGLAFSKSKQELFVTDKWNHCIHVFNYANEYSRTICSKGSGNGRLRSPDGIAIGPNDELIVSDSGNDRIVLLNPETGAQISKIGLIKEKTTLNLPTGLTMYKDNIIVADTGNHRIKTFNIKGELLQEFGSYGQNRGQFRSAEVVAVDPLGFIFVGDCGNARIQIFSPDGTLVKIFGASHGHSGFKWVSGICVTPSLDILTCDSKTRSLKIF